MTGFKGTTMFIIIVNKSITMQSNIFPIISLSY